MVSSLSVVMQRSIDGSMGDVTDCPDNMVNFLAMVSMNEGCDRCIVPRSRFLLILMPSSRLGSPRSDILKLPLMLLTIRSMDFWESAASKLSSMVIEGMSLRDWKSSWFPASDWRQLNR